MNPIQQAINFAGGPVALTRALNARISKPVTYQAVLKWARQGHLPRTEWTGETSYAKAISGAIGGQIKVNELLVRPVVSNELKPDEGRVVAVSDAQPVAEGAHA